MLLFKEKLKEYIENIDLILRDEFDYNQSGISVIDLEEIDELFSLYIMFKNGVIGKLRETFLKKIDDLNQEIEKEKIFKLFEDLNLVISKFKEERK